LDQWELKREDVELLMDKPLGKGAFGEVYRGLLQPKVMQKVPAFRKYPGRKTSINCIVAVKMLKGKICPTLCMHQIIKAPTCMSRSKDSIVVTFSFMVT